MKTARITQSRGIFSLACGVELNIRTPAAPIWSLLNVHGTHRTFTPRVSGVVSDKRMTWTGGFFPLFKGVRTFELRPCDDGSTDFVMKERFSGLMLPFARGSMPDFGPVFERYANDLKREAELRGPGL